MAKVSMLLIMVALIAGMVGCAEPSQYSLSISTSEGGEVATPNEMTSSYDEGTKVPLVALPHSGYRFINWTGDVAAITNTEDATTTVTMNCDYSITANFQFSATISDDWEFNREILGDNEFSILVHQKTKMQGSVNSNNWYDGIETDDGTLIRIPVSEFSDGSNSIKIRAFDGNNFGPSTEKTVHRGSYNFEDNGLTSFNISVKIEGMTGSDVVSEIRNAKGIHSWYDDEIAFVMGDSNGLLSAIGMVEEAQLWIESENYLTL